MVTFLATYPSRFAFRLTPPGSLVEEETPIAWTWEERDWERNVVASGSGFTSQEEAYQAGLKHKETK